jgi:hypothetical protein
MNVTVLKTDRTAAARAKRYRRRRKQAAVTVNPRHARSRDGVTVIVTVAALALATVSGGFAVVGMAAIFTGAFWPIVGMGVAFEFGKLAGVAWLGRRYAAPRPVKVALAALVVTLMALNAVGAYGFLARAHLDHAVAGEVAISARASDVAARTEVQHAVLADVDRRMAEIDAAVAEATRRGRTTTAMDLAEHQRRNRAELAADRLRAATALAALRVEAARVDGDRTKIAADTGPVRYLSALLGIDDEAAIRWFILVVAVLLDLLALVLLLAATTRGEP